MACLTPGVLSNLLHNAAGNNLSSPLLSSHRFPLLQVIEIVPCLSDDHWRNEGFFLKVSDSLHAAYVAVSSADDVNLIRSDEIQLGQLVYIRGGLHIDNGCPLPVIRGLKPVPKRRLCIGNPTDLVSSDLLLPFTQTTTKKKTKNLVETKRFSLDSSRRSCWEQTTPVSHRRDAALLLSSPRLKPKSIFIDKSPSKHLNCENPVSRNKNVVKPPASPISLTKSPKDGGIKSLSKAAMAPSGELYKLPLSHMNWSDQRIFWNGLPKAIQLLGKEVSSHRQVAASTAVTALEEASTMESVLRSLQEFAELCDSSKKLSVGQVVRRFLNIYYNTQNIGKELITRNRNKGSCSLIANQNATSWVQAAVVNGFSQFNLFKKEEDDVDNHHYIVIQNSSKKLNPKETKSTKNIAFKGVKPTSYRSVSNQSRLKESASLADELVRVSSQWFLKYLEDSLVKGSFTVKNGKEVNRWLDDLILSKTETREKVEELRKKLQRFLLEHIKTAIGETR